MAWRNGFRFGVGLTGVGLGLCLANAALAESTPLRVGAAAAELIADNSMVLGGSLLGGKVTEQEGKLRAVAVVLAGPGPAKKVAIVACDVLMIQRDILDKACEEIERTVGIPANNVLINCTHTHSAPTTVTVHGYEREEGFSKQVGEKCVEAVRLANENLEKSGPATFWFRLGEESSVGQNSRLLLPEGTTFWVGRREDAIRPTGPFDPELPVLSFKDKDGKAIATIFNHSTHTIGGRKPNVRSPAFYGLAAQELEPQVGGVVQFLEGASGSTHNLNLMGDEMVLRIKKAVTDALAQAQPRPVGRLASIKREIPVRVRDFDELKDDDEVRRYAATRVADPKGQQDIIEVFRKARRILAPLRGTTKKTYVQTVLIGDVAIVGAPGEFFTKLGQEIKRQSPFRHTYVAELANDWVGYIPDSAAYELGGYQVWTGLHSYLARGTGEEIVAEAVRQLKELHDNP